MLPPGSVVVVTASAAFTVILRLAVAVAAVGLVESETLTVKLEVPLAVGDPVMAPVLVFRVSPAGRLPVLIDQV
jgi:hypothetical protein